MPWYVFALVDEPPASRPGRGLREPLTTRRVPAGFAVVERRADVPPPEFDTLRLHEAVVTRLAAMVPAILPVRFGTLLEIEEIEEALAERTDEIADAFDAVRGRVQFTWRQQRGRPEARAEVRGRGGAKRDTRDGELPVMSGAEYLRAAAKAAAPPPSFRTVREKLRPLVVAERFQPATPTLPNSLYQLVERGSVERYGLIAKKLASARAALRVSGPFPPFAFIPELL